MSFFSKVTSQFLFRRSLTTFATPGIRAIQPQLSSGITPISTLLQPNFISPLGLLSQRRWKSRGNTYQPSTLKRKRKFGFLAKATSKLKSKILKNRRDKGRWYLTH